MGFLWFLLAVLIIAIIIFAVWFIVEVKSGKCPFCALQRFTKPTKITMDISEDEKYNNGAALTPPMGWSSWNTFRQNISEEIIFTTAAAMKLSGLQDAGYQYINIDDCWHSSMRDKEGRLQGDLEKFPNGIAPLVNKINSLGLKVGIYTSNGTLTCEDLPASLYNEELDAKTIALWGCEFFKYDYCHHEIINGDAPAIEAVEISHIGKSAEIRLNPEDAEFTGKAKIIKAKRVPSKKGIGFISHGAGTAIFRPIIESDGNYAITLLTCKMITFKKQYIQVIVNGELHEVFVPKTLAYSGTGRVQLVVKMKSGLNEIILRNPVRTDADSAYIEYSRMGRALKKASREVALEYNRAERPITYSICEWGFNFPWMWGEKAGNLWRTTPDIKPFWFSILKIYEFTLKHYQNASPGAWNDPDMLEVGNGKLTEDENKSHFALWCMLAAPLILGNDIRRFVDTNGKPVENDPILKIVTNKELIAIDQDTLGKQAKRIKKSHGIDIIARPLANGDAALCFLNKSSKTKGISFDIDELTQDKYIALTRNSTYSVHDLWTDERFGSKTISATIPKHGSKVFRISSK